MAKGVVAFLFVASSAVNASKAEISQCNVAGVETCISLEPLDKMSVLQHAVNVHHDRTRNATAHVSQLQNHSIAQMVAIWRDTFLGSGPESGDGPGASVLLLFILAAWWSICHEVYCVQVGTAETSSRDPLWDVAKFGLLVLVGLSHSKVDNSVWWYEAFFLPSFFIIAGQFQQGKDAFDRTVMVRVLRDNILNNLILWLLLKIVPGTVLPSSWFLWALASYRLILAPCCNVMTGWLGDLFGSLASVVGGGCFILGYSLGNLDDKHPLIKLCGHILLLNGGSIWGSDLSGFLVRQIFQNAVFYLLGLTVKRKFMRKVISSPYTSICGLVYLAVWPLNGITLGQEVPIGVSLGKLACVDLWKAFGAFALIACAAPVADTNIVFLKPLSCLFAACGKRTLYGYVLQMVLALVFNSTWRWFTSISNHALVSILMVALCSPLAEYCFAWLVSPQWALDALVFLHSRASSAVCNVGSSCGCLLTSFGIGFPSQTKTNEVTNVPDGNAP